MLGLLLERVTEGGNANIGATVPGNGQCVTVGCNVSTADGNINRAVRYGQVHFLACT